MKTWVDLLGSDTTACKVDGSFIVRETAPTYFKILWTLYTKEQAEAVFREWCLSCTKREQTLKEFGEILGL